MARTSINILDSNKWLGNVFETNIQGIVYNIIYF